MRTRTLSLTSILGFLGLVLLVHSFNSHAAVKGISCSTTFSEKEFTISEGKIDFVKKYDQDRGIASVKNVITHKKHMGFTKTMYIDGLKHKINIKDVNDFSEANDYLSITSPKGHEMTYPLNCHQA